MRPVPSLRQHLDRALIALGEILGRPVALDTHGLCRLHIGRRPPVTIEWNEPAGCVAVHSLLPRTVLPGRRDALAPALLAAHLGGGATLGCAFWMTAEGKLVVGHTLLGPTLDEHLLLEAIGRVCRVVDRIANPAAGGDLGAILADP